MDEFYEHEHQEGFSSIDKMSVTIEFTNGGSHVQTRHEFNEEEQKLIALSALTNPTLCTIFDIKNAQTSIDMANIVEENDNRYQILKLLFPEKLCEIAAINEDLEKLDEYMSAGFPCNESVINSAVLYNKINSVNFLIQKGYEYAENKLTSYAHRKVKTLKIKEEEEDEDEEEYEEISLPVVGKVSWIANLTEEEIKNVRDFFSKMSGLEILLGKNLNLLRVSTETKDRIENYSIGSSVPIAGQNQVFRRDFPLPLQMNMRVNPVDPKKLEKTSDMYNQMINKLSAHNIIINNRIENLEKNADILSRAIYLSKKVENIYSYELFDSDIAPYVAIFRNDINALEFLFSKGQIYDMNLLSDFAKKLNMGHLANDLKNNRFSTGRKRSRLAIK